MNTMFSISPLIRLVSFTILLATASCTSLNTTTDNGFGDVAAEVVTDDTWVVVIKDPRSDRQRSNLRGPAYNARLAYSDSPVLHRYASRIANDHSMKILSEWPLQNLGVHCFLVEGRTAQSRLKLEEDERVLWVQSFNEFELKNGAKEYGRQSTGVLNRFTQQFSGRGNNIRVAVVDTAVDRSHPDLRNAMLDVQNFSGSRGRPSSELHGTAVVGLIAANPSRADGIRGIASDAKTHLLRGCWQDPDGSGRCNTLTLALALDAAIGLEPDIINLSLSGGRDRVLDALIKTLTDNGTLVVAAYDDGRSTSNRFPSPGPGVIYAYGLDQENDTGPQPSNILVASKHVVSLAPMSGYDLVSGHSVAAPQLTAMAAVLMEAYVNDERGDTITRLDGWLEENYTVR